MTEYRKIPGFEDYEIGSNGSVWARKCNNKYGELIDGWYCSAGTVTKSGYIRFILCHNGEIASFYAHSLVLLAFVGPRPFPEAVCRHLDGNPANNNLDNLKWGTVAENMADAVRHGRSQQGDKHLHCKLSEDAVYEIRARGPYEKKQPLADKFGVSLQTISRVLTRRTWKHLPPGPKKRLEALPSVAGESDIILESCHD